MPKPFFQLFANGTDVTQNLQGVGVELSITDGEGYSADSLTVMLDDADGRIDVPPTGAVLRVVGGYQDGASRDFGEFVVDHISLRGYPQQISINAKSLAAKALGKQRETTSFSARKFPTYGDIFEDVASRAGLALSMADRFRQVPNEYEAQSEEDGLEFLTRLGQWLGAAVSVKSQRIVVVERGGGKSVSGGLLDQITIAPGRNLLTYSLNLTDEPAHAEVEASYYDRTANARKTVTAPIGIEGPVLRIRDPFPDEQSSDRAAKSLAREVIRKTADAVFEINGDPLAMAEAWVQVQGVRTLVDGTWRAKVVTHNFSATAPYTCSIECERPG